MAFSGERLRRRREELGISQVELAALIGTSQSNIYRYETKGISPNSEKLLQMAEKLDTTTDFLMGRVHDPSVSVNLTSGELAVLRALRRRDFPKLLELITEETKTE